jgi:hypothetical protein
MSSRSIVFLSAKFAAALVSASRSRLEKVALAGYKTAPGTASLTLQSTLFFLSTLFWYSCEEKQKWVGGGWDNEGLKDRVKGLGHSVKGVYLRVYVYIKGHRV